jgi:hypothetical protein
MVCVAAIIAVFFIITVDRNETYVRYNCSISEISPDYPVAVKEACRKRSLK